MLIRFVRESVYTRAVAFPHEGIASPLKDGLINMSVSFRHASMKSVAYEDKLMRSKDTSGKKNLCACGASTHQHGVCQKVSAPEFRRLLQGLDDFESARR